MSVNELALGVMPLYVDPERIYRELSEAGHTRDGPLAAAALFPFDQIHYFGTEAVKIAIDAASLRSTSRVLDVGSGYGGPARYLASTVGCTVVALELQRAMHDIAVTLTARCGLAGRVSHVCGDALTQPLPSGGFDAVVSWLAIHHIPSRPQLLTRLAATLRPGGRIYIEDLCVQHHLSQDEQEAAVETLCGRSLTAAEDYVRELEQAGFKEVEAGDLTEEWSQFCTARAAAWRRDRERHVRVHGEPMYSRLDEFFSAVARLFRCGAVAGVRLVAQRV